MTHALQTSSLQGGPSPTTFRAVRNERSGGASG